MAGRPPLPYAYPPQCLDNAHPNPQRASGPSSPRNALGATLEPLAGIDPMVVYWQAEPCPPRLRIFWKIRENPLLDLDGINRYDIIQAVKNETRPQSGAGGGRKAGRMKHGNAYENTMDQGR